MHIHSVSPAVVQSLQTIRDIVLQHQGFINPHIQIHHQNERLWISCATSEHSTLLAIPDELFVPVSHLEWTSNNDQITYSGNLAELSAVQQDLLQAMLAIYNATNKLNEVGKKLPSHLLHYDDQLLDWLQASRPALILSNVNPARDFIETRLNFKNSGSNPTDNTGFLMPIIDMLNHHPQGANYQRSEQGNWCIPLQHPIQDSDECFLRYGKLDSLSMAMWHGYFESNTRYLASLDCLLKHEVLGEVRIIGTNAARRKISAPRLLPAESMLTLQDIVLDRNQLLALKTLLGLAVRSKRRDLAQPEAEAIADDLIQLLVDANLREYSELQALCRADAEHFALRSLFGKVAEHQLGLLNDMQVS